MSKPFNRQSVIKEFLGKIIRAIGKRKGSAAAKQIMKSPEMKKIARITRLNEVVNCKKRGIPPLWNELGTCTLFYTEQVVFQLQRLFLLLQPQK